VNRDLLVMVSCVVHLPDTHTALIAKTALKAGFAVAVIMPGALEPELVAAGVTHHPLPATCHHFWHSASWAELARAATRRAANSAILAYRLLRLKPKVCVTTEPDSWLVAALLNLISKVRIIADLREMYEEREEAFPRYLRQPLKTGIAGAMALLSRTTYHAIIPSERRRRSAPWLRCPTSVIHPLPDLALFPEFSYQTRRSRSAGHVVFIHAGALRPSYASDELILAFAAAHQRNSEIRLLVLGGVAGRLKQADLLSRLVSEGIVILKQKVSFAEVCEMLPAADVGLSLVLPVDEIHRLAQPRKLYEYLAAGLPVLVADVPPLRELVDSERCGVYVDSSDPAAICEAVLELASNPSRREILGRMARMAAETKYNWSNVELSLMGVLRGECPTGERP
jgi:glycosyltransferase involved in cell wall biosynthesis